ncbi:hypothetical protein NEFER03_0514 [Nematocida sp. LUAm3]|nr:hypothetical protein NEFER03_0514 [Nematocida sp. LUAm3]KAI5175481.1 hypothetical protein NEFER02_1387 [Nematocida sp. LUAm2]KAI5178489.1 hypothetical protein NEFER01_1636 [Nematocida sp. LUAm1]
MDEKDKVLCWLSQKEIANMEEYVQVLQKNVITHVCRVTLWGLALTKSLFKRTETPPTVIYNVFLPCTEKFMCTSCYNQRYLEKIKEKKGPITEASLNASLGAASNAKEDKKSESPDKKKKDAEKKKDKKKEKEEERELTITDEEINSIIKHIDKGFAENEIMKKTVEERLYFVHTVLHILQKTSEYKIILENKAVDPQNFTKIIGLVIVAISYLTSIQIKAVVKMMLLLITNINGIFCEKKEENITVDEFTKFLLFIQSTASISDSRFIRLFDILSTLNQPLFLKFVTQIIKGEINVSSIKPDLFSSYSAVSAKEIETFRNGNPFKCMRIFSPEIVYTHHDEKKSFQDLSEENTRLKENISVLMGDLKAYNQSNVIVKLKEELNKSSTSSSI